jgi:twinkle protein
MTKTLKSGQPCPCGRSSDAFVIYDSGWGHCFSGKCGGTNHKVDPDTLYPEPSLSELKSTRKNTVSLEEIQSYESRGNAERRLLKNVAEFYGIKASTAPDGSVERFFFPSVDPGSNTVSAYKVKNPRDKKDTYIVGGKTGLMGIEHFRNGGKRIVVTEGEEDCWAIQSANFLKYGKFYPVVHMGSASQTKNLLAERDTLLKFDEVVLWFDNDEEGNSAVEKAAKIIGYDRVKVVRSDQKDANDTLMLGTDMKKAADQVVYLMLDAKPYNPAGIVRGSDTWLKFKSQKEMKFLPWPPFLSKLNSMTFGRAIPSITMLAAGTGVGKSSLLREDIMHVRTLKQPSEKIGGVFLEETVGETTQGLLSIALNKRVGLPTTQTTEEEEYEAWKSIFVREDGEEDFLLIDHQGSVSDSSLLDKIEFLAVSGCKYIYLDHITIAVSEEKDNVNAAIDHFMNRLLQLVQRHQVWICVVSHLRKVKAGEDSFESGARIFEDDLKGSGSLKQVAYQTIALSRNKLDEDETQRHTTAVWLLKDRRTGSSGPAGYYRFDGTTGRLVEVEPVSDRIEISSDIEIIGA